MRKKISVVGLLFFIAIAMVLIFCNEQVNPLDPHGNGYKETTATIFIDSLTDSSMIKVHTLTTQDSFSLGITSEFFSRISKISIDYTKDLVDDSVYTIIIDDQSVKTLQLHKFRYVKPGQYTIHVHVFTLNEVDLDLELQVEVLPVGATISNQPKNIDVNDGHSASFSCIAYGTQPLYYQWFKIKSASSDTTTGSTVYEYDTLYFKNDSILSFENIFPEDSGEYICMISNLYDTVFSDLVTLTVLPPVPDNTWPKVSFLQDSSSGPETQNTTVSIVMDTVFYRDVKVAVAVLSTTTADSSDFSLNDTVIVFQPGSKNIQLPIKIFDDYNTEADKNIILGITPLYFANVGQISTFSYKILDDDVPSDDWPRLYFQSEASSVEEGKNANIAVKLSKTVAYDINVDLSILASSSAEKDDYEMKDSVLTITAGSDLINIPVQTTDDNILEDPETIIFNISKANHARIDSAFEHTLTIYDNDTPDSTWPVVSFSQPGSSTSEGNDATITLTVSSPSSRKISVKYGYLVSSSAKIGSDFELNDSIVTFEAGETKKELSVPIIDDKIKENDETVILNLVKGNQCKIDTSAVHTLTIQDNDRCYVGFAKKSQTVIETDEGTVDDSILVILSTVCDRAVSVNYSINTDSTNATGNGVDYTLLGNQMITFPAFKDSAWIRLSVSGDILAEGDERLSLDLKNQSEGILLDSVTSNIDYILVDNETVSISFVQADTTINESAGKISIPVRLSTESDDTVKISFSLVASEQGSTSDISITDNPAKTLVFAPGITMQNIWVTIVDDQLDETDEVFTLELTEISGPALFGMTRKLDLTIKDNDTPVMSFNTASSSVIEDSTIVRIPVSLSTEAVSGTKARIVISDSSTAQGKGVDYIFMANDTITFEPGKTSVNVELTLVQDAIDENEETVILTLVPLDSITSLGAIPVHTLLIQDNDSPPSLSFSAANENLTESNTNKNIPVVLSSASGKEISVNFRVLGTSTASIGGVNADCVFSNVTNGEGVLTFSPGVTTASIPFSLFEDTLNEETETVILRLFNPVNSSIGTDSTHTISILDNNFVVTVQKSGSGNVVPSGTRVLKAGENLDITASALSHNHFVQWTTTSALTIDDKDKESTKILNVTSDGTVRAIFAIDTHTIVVSRGDNGLISDTGTHLIPYNKTLSISSVVPDEGYKFIRWDISDTTMLKADSIYKPSAVFTVHGNATVRPIFDKYDYEVLVSHDLHGTVQDSGSHMVNHGENFTISATADPHYHFKSWVVGGGILASQLVDISASTTVIRNLTSSGTVTATFEVDKHAITLSSAAHGSANPSGITNVNHFDSLAIRAIPAEGYSFDHWNILSGSNLIKIRNVNAESTFVAEIDGDAEIQSTFKINYYWINLTSGGNGDVVLPIQDSVKVEYDGIRSIKAVPNTGYRFLRWVIVGNDPDVKITSLTSDSTTFYGVKGAATIRADFVKNVYKLTVLSPEDGVINVSPDTNSRSYEYLTSVTCTAVPATGFELASWGGALAGTVTSSGTVIMDTAKTVSATFKRINYLVNVSSAGNGDITAGAGNNLIPYQGSLTIAASPAFGYKFSNWTVTNGNLHIQNTIASSTSVTAIDDSGSVQAVFVKDSFLVTIDPPTNGSITVSPNSSTGIYEYLSTISFTAEPAFGYEFEAWTDDMLGTTTATGSLIINGPKTVSATFRRASYVVNVTSAGNGSIITGLGNNTVAYEGTLSIEASPDYGYKFSHWVATNGTFNIQNINSAATSVTGVANSGSIQAVFIKDSFTVTIIQPRTDSGSILISPVSTNAKYEYLSNVNLSVSPAFGWKFLRWGGTLNGETQNFTLTVTKDTTITVFFEPIPVGNKIICVRNNAADGGDGRSWGRPFNKLQDALSVATENDTIWVTGGTYNPGLPDNLARYYLEDAGLVLLGGFTGVETSANQRNWKINQTILDGNDLSDTIMSISPSALNARVDGFVISGAFKVGTYVNSPCTIQNCVFRSNNVAGAGGGTALHINSSDVTVISSVFHNNSGTSGTAIIVRGSKERVFIGNCVVVNNKGPAISNAGLSTEILSCTIANNTATTSLPGGITNTGTMYLESSIVWGNANSTNDGTQINTTDYVIYSCVMDADGTGIRTKGSNWQVSNITSSPGFTNTSIPANGGDWFDSNSNNPPFIPDASSDCTNYSRYTINSKVTNDLRGLRRYTPYEIGAYERY